MKPTIGRIVHYYTTNPKEQFNGQGVGPYAAIVAQAFGCDYANLKVLPPFAAPYDHGSVECRELAFKRVTGANLPSCWWEWPPVQSEGAKQG